MRNRPRVHRTSTRFCIATWMRLITGTPVYEMFESIPLQNDILCRATLQTISVSPDPERYRPAAVFLQSWDRAVLTPARWNIYEGYPQCKPRLFCHIGLNGQHLVDGVTSHHHGTTTSRCLRMRERPIIVYQIPLCTNTFSTEPK